MYDIGVGLSECGKTAREPTLQSETQHGGVLQPFQDNPDIILGGPGY